MQTRSSEDIERRDLQLRLGEEINALLSATRALSERSAAQFYDGLQPAAFHIARWLHAFGPAKPSVIAEEVGMDRSSTSTLIGRMRALDLLVSAPDPKDRRGVIVHLTELGRNRVIETLANRGTEFYARTDNWPLRDLDDLVRLLRQLTSDTGDHSTASARALIQRASS